MRRDRRDNRHAIIAMAIRLAPDANCIDVGAHRGAFLAHMTRLAPQGRHVACEPLPHLAADLRSNFPAATVHEVALANEDGEATFHFLPTMQGFSGLHDVAPGEHEVQELQVRLARLDDLLDPELPISLIKIDVEGAELGRPDGAERTLRRWKPTVLLEHGTAAASFGTTSATSTSGSPPPVCGCTTWTAPGPSAPMRSPRTFATASAGTGSRASARERGRSARRWSRAGAGRAQSRARGSRPRSPGASFVAARPGSVSGSMFAYRSSSTWYPWRSSSAGAESSV